MARDGFQIFRDLELKAVGLDPETNKMQEGYFMSVRGVGLPIHKEDYANLYSRLDGNLKKAIPKTDPVDPGRLLVGRQDGVHSQTKTSRETSNPAHWNRVSVAAPFIFLLILLLALPHSTPAKVDWNLFEFLQAWVGTLLGFSLFGVVSSIIAFLRSEKFWGLSLLGLLMNGALLCWGSLYFFLLLASGWLARDLSNFVSKISSIF
ncbi:MAG: hypothetical protein ACREXX_20050 [Gammaproteobacteria bacterium]